MVRRGRVVLVARMSAIEGMVSRGDQYSSMIQKNRGPGFGRCSVKQCIRSTQPPGDGAMGIKDNK